MVLPHRDGRAVEASSLSSSIRVSIAVLLAAVACAADAPKRIISASPNVTEILYGVGAFDRVIAVSDYCTYPPAVKSLPHIGKWQDNNMEQIVSLRPDLLIMSDVQEPLFGPQLRQLGIHIVAAPTRTLDDTFRAIEVIGRATGHETQARELEARVRLRLDAVRHRTSRLSRRRVLMVVDRTPGTLRDLYVATPGSFLADLIEIAGGLCITAPVPIGYSKINKEAVLALAPDLIIDFVHGSTSRLGEDPYSVWRDLSELKAVRERQVYPLRNEFLPHSSQFVADTAELLARIIHPETAGGKKAAP